MRNEERDVQARRAAQALWEKGKKQNEEVLKERDKERIAEASKVARLRELRLAKEAAEREAASEAAKKAFISTRRKSRTS